MRQFHDAMVSFAERRKTNMERKISVIIPAYNREHTIIKAIKSVLNQTYSIDEVIVVDDCSTDGTGNKVKSVDDERVRYFALPNNLGAGGARNYGVKKARNDIIAFHDSDDAWLPDKIEKQMVLLETGEYDLVYGAYRMHLPYNILHIVPEMNSNLKLQGDIFKDLLLGNTIGAPTILMKKQVFEEIGGFDETMRSLEDWDLAIRVAKRYPIGFVPEVLMEVESSAGGVSSNIAQYYNCRCYMLRKFRADYLETGMLNAAVLDILGRAKYDGVEDQISKMIMLYMQ